MAIIYAGATLRPTKLELLGAWLPSQPWYVGDGASQLTYIGAYRFDDPAGDVGIETHLVRVGDNPVLQVPLTYRGAELPGAEAALIDTMEHSVLGHRWVYDACADPVYASALANALFHGGEQAEMHLADSDEVREPSVVVRGSGEAAGAATYTDVEYATDDARTVCTVADAQIEVLRAIDSGARPAGDNTLTGTWEGQPDAALLARGRRN